MAKQFRLLACVCVVVCGVAGASDAGDDAVRQRIDTARPHPRLLMLPEDEALLREELSTNDTKKAIFALVRKSADEVLGQTPVVRQKEGKRLLGVSREALRRVLTLAFVWRVTGESAYADRAVREMEAAAAFTDWNPSHFLDVAEMTTALAIGYDWLLPILSPEQESTLRSAILEKGIRPSLEEIRHWVRGNNNWNQVCHGGMVMGVLALAEHEPDMAARVIQRAVDGLPYAMKEYQPDGVYPEGPSYWDYGTTYNILCIAALESSLNTDFGLIDFPGFKETGAFPLYMNGPTGDHFTFSDCGSKGGCSPAVYWFARRLDDSGLAFMEHRWLEKLLRGEASSQGRFLPLLLLWWDGRTPEAPRQPLSWKGEGINPVAVHRTSWTDPNAVYLAIKGGTPSANHGHMDIGSFILEADGVRWAVDIMGRGYGDLEARGLNIWSMFQDSDRWRIYRYHNRSHNTLTVNNQAQHVKGRAEIRNFSAAPETAHTLLDMQPVYKKDLAKARRCCSLLPDGRVRIQDVITAGKHEARVRWAMTTPATMTDIEPGRATLVLGDKRLFMDVLAPGDAAVQSFPTDTGNEWDLNNPDIHQVGFEVNLAKDASADLVVVFTPGSRETERGKESMEGANP